MDINKLFASRVIRIIRDRLMIFEISNLKILILILELYNNFNVAPARALYHNDASSIVYFQKGLYMLSTCVSAGNGADALEIKRIADNEDGN